MKARILKPIKEDTADWDEVEERIKEAFKREIYAPLLRLFRINPDVLANSTEDLVEAIQSGRIAFNRGTFSGKFDAAVSRELYRIGATWDRKTRTFKVLQSSLPIEIREAVRASHERFTRQLEKMNDRVEKILPEKVAESVNVSKIFDQTIWKVDRDFKSSMEGLIVPPDLTHKRIRDISVKWQNNLRKYIKDWTADEIVRLRADIGKAVLSGNRYESLVSMIEKRYEVSKNKAKFLARQETSLMMTTFKQSRYEESGVKTYVWGCVAGSPKHPVRPAHKKLEGKEWAWNNPPITTAPGEPVRRNNPGQDYNCRCFARPVVKFK